MPNKSGGRVGILYIVPLFFEILYIFLHLAWWCWQCAEFIMLEYVSCSLIISSNYIEKQWWFFLSRAFSHLTRRSCGSCHWVCLRGELHLLIYIYWKKSLFLWDKINLILIDHLFGMILNWELTGNSTSLIIDRMVSNKHQRKDSIFNNWRWKAR